MGFKEKIIEFNDRNPLAKAKLLYFFYAAIVRSLPRYLGLYYKHTLLLSPHQVAVLLSVRYFSQLCGSPILGAIADKMNRYRNVLIVCLLAMLATYIAVPLVESVDGFNCQNHLGNKTLLIVNVTSNTSTDKSNRKFRVNIHRYNSELYTDPLGKHYHGNMMYDLYYTWPFETFEYKSTDDITYKVFVTLLIVTVVGEFFASPGETFLDLYTIQALGNEDKKFGWQLIPGVIGWLIIVIIFAVVTNTDENLKDDFCHVGKVINYSPYLHAVYALLVVCIILATLLKYNRYTEASKNSPKKSSQHSCNCNLLKAFPVLFKSPADAAYSVSIIFCGVGAGVKQLYIYHYISDLGGPLYLLPVLSTVQLISNILALTLSPYLLQKFGHVKIISVGLFAYGVIFVVYSLIENAWLVFLVEPFDGLTMLSWVAIVTYAGSPPRIGAALQGLVHGLYRGLGIAIGYLVVGVMILKYGYLALFLGLGLIFFAVFGFYVSILHYYPKERTISEEHRELYTQLQSIDETDEEDEEEEENRFRDKKTFERSGTLKTRNPKSYDEDRLDTSFLE